MMRPGVLVVHFDVILYTARNCGTPTQILEHVATLEMRRTTYLCKGTNDDHLLEAIQLLFPPRR